MKTTTHFKYIAWKDPKGLHEDTLQSLSDLKFLKDELLFLEHLVSQHAMALLFETVHPENETLSAQLNAHRQSVDKLLVVLQGHSNNLQVLLDDIEVLNEVKLFKDEHYRLMMEELNIHAKVKKTKRIIFKMLAEIMKKNKQKKLS